MRTREDDFDGESASGGVKGIEKMERLRARMRSHPGERYAHVTKKVAEIMRNDNVRTLESYVQSQSHIPRDRLSIMIASLFCEVIRAVEEGSADRACDVACSGLMLLDQYHINGNLDLAWNITLLPEPTSLRLHKSKPNVAAAAKAQGRRGTSRFSDLVEHKVVSSALNEMANYDRMAKMEDA